MFHNLYKTILLVSNSEKFLYTSQDLVLFILYVTAKYKSYNCEFTGTLNYQFLTNQNAHTKVLLLNTQ